MEAAMDQSSHGGRAGGEDLADALAVLRDLAEWFLPPDEWATIDQTVSALSAAIIAGDVAALRHEVIELELIGPTRSQQLLTREGDLPAPAEIRDRVRAAIALIEGPPGVPPQARALVPVAIYLADAAGHERVENAVEQLLAMAGLAIVSRDDPVQGSWFRSMWAREVAATALNAAESRLVMQQDAQVTAIYLQNLPALIAALQPTKDAVVRAGAFLVVKVDWVVAVHQLTPSQQLALNHSPQLVAAPHEILHALGLIDTGSGTALSAEDRQTT
jgi:hypothetical protein